MLPDDPPNTTDPAAVPRPAGRTRPKPGERRLQILQMLATMLQEPKAERVTTAARRRREPLDEHGNQHALGMRDLTSAISIQRRARQ